MLQFIIGKRHSGKTTEVHKLLGNKAQNGEGTMLIVPKQYTYESDKSILKLLGPKDASDVEVLSFSRLVNVAFAQYGFSEKPIAKEGARIILMSLAIEALFDKLSVFIRHKNDFALVTKMLSAVDEFKKVGITADDLAEYSEKISDKTLRLKIKETALIYASYEAIVGENWFDDSDVLSKMAEILFENEFFKGKTVALDGFYEFSFGELKLIETMLKHCETVYVTLCTDDIESANELSAFAIVNKTARKLKRLCGKNGVSVAKPILTKKDANTAKADISFLEENLFKINHDIYKEKSDNVSVMVSSDIYKECDAVSRKIKKYLRTGEYRCRDMAVVYRDGDVYERLMKASFKKYGIPYFEDRRQKVETQPLMNIVKNLLFVCCEGFDSDSIMRMLKTGLFSFSQKEISQLENYIFMWDIDGNKWLSAWSYNPDGFDSEDTDKQKEALKEINLLREKTVSTLLSFRDSIKDKSGMEITEALYNFLRDNKIDEGLKEYAISLEQEGLLDLALEQEQVWDILMEVFDEIAGVLCERTVNIKRYFEIFSLIVSSKSLGKLPDGFDEVSVSSANRMLTKSTKVLFALGMNYGSFPLTQSTEGLISMREKESLREAGLDIGESISDFAAKERFILYSALFSATEKLYLSYITSSQSGETLVESECIKIAETILPEMKKIFISEETKEDLIESESAAFELMAKTWHENTPKAKALRKYFKDKKVYKNRLEAIERATSDENFFFEDKDNSLKLFGEKMYLSASRIESYYKCPFMYFCKYGLYAKPRVKARLDPAKSGTVIHYCLEEILKKYKGREFLNLTDQQLRNEIKYYLLEFLNRKMGTAEDKTERFNYLYERMKKTLARILEIITAEFQNSDFEMCDFELSIDYDSQVKPMEISLNKGSVSIKGSVDRVDKLDLNGKRYIRVIDYKTGSKEFILSDVLYGLNMQMLLYLVSIVRSKEGFYKNSVPSGVLYFPAALKAVNTLRDEDERALKKKLYSASKMNGMLVGESEITECMDKEKSGIFLPLKFDKSGLVKGNFISVEQFQKLGERMDRLIKKMGDSIHDGVIPAKPAIGPDYGKTCEWCDFSEVCLREKGEYRYIESMKHDDALKIISGGEDIE